MRDQHPAGRARAAWAAACLLLLCALPSPAAPPESPFPKDAHKDLVRGVQQAQCGEYRRVLAEFDDWLKRVPGDGVAAVERCRFIDNFVGDETPGVEGAEEDSEQCRASLEKGPAAVTAVARLFLLENTYGKDARGRAEALLGQSADWTPAQRAELYAQLATSWQHDDPLKAGGYALKAVELDPQSGQHLSAAEYLVRIGAVPRAVAALEGTPQQQWQNWSLRSAVVLLLDNRQPQAALRLLRQRPDLKLDAPLRVRLARSLLDAGDDLVARDLMKAVQDEPPPKLASRGFAAERELFEFQRDHGDRADAIAAYRKLRDKGYAGDPLGRYRLGLLWRYPGAPWHWADLAGIAAMLGWLAAAALLPLAVVVPLHYRGAVRRARGEALPPAGPAWPWGLGHLWYGLAMTTIGSVLGLYLYCYPDLETLLRGAKAAASANADAAALGHAFEFIEVFDFLALAPLLLRTRPLPLLAGEWPLAKSAGVGFAMAFIVFIVGGALNKLAQAAGVLPGVALGGDTSRALQGIYAAQGAAALMLSAAVVTPAIEEFLFRGVFLRVAQRNVHFWIAALLQGLVFLALHEEAAPSLLLLALAGAWLARQSGGLLAPFALHATNNAFATLAIMGLTQSVNAGH